MTPTPVPRRWWPLAVVTAAGLVLTGVYAYWVGVPFADTYTYLDPGRNYWAGRGFVSRFNVVYGWSGTIEHAGLAYYNPLYGFALGTLWTALDDPAWVSALATAVPACLNAALLGLLVRRSMGDLTAVLSAIGYLLLPTTWYSLTLIAAEHPAVTLVLVTLLLVERRVPSRAVGWIGVGVLLGAAALIKLTVLLAVPGVIAALAVSSPERGLRARAREALRPAAGIAVGIAALLVPYTTACAMTVGETYPSYPRMARNWSLAKLYGGRFVAASPAIEPDAANLPSARDRAFIALDNVQTLIRSAGMELGVLVVFLGLGVARAGAARRAAALLLLVGASMVLCHALSFDWLRLSTEAPSPARYALYAAAFWYPVAVYGLVQLVAPAATGAGRVWLAVGLWAVCSLPNLASVAASLGYLSGRSEPRATAMRRMMTELAGMVGGGDLVAVEGGGVLVGAAVFLDRPVVVLPQDGLDRPEVMRQFVEVFQPALVVPGVTRSVHQVLPAMGYEVAVLPQLNRMVVYRRPTRESG